MSRRFAPSCRCAVARRRWLVLGVTCLLALPPATAPAAGAPITAAIPAALPAPSATTPTLRVPDYRRVVLPNGIVLLMMPLREVPLTAFTAVVRGGALGDSAGKAGLASLVAGLLGREWKGSTPTSSLELADLILEHAEVAAVPGEAFGPSGYLRFSYALGDADLLEGIQRVQALFGTRD